MNRRTLIGSLIAAVASGATFDPEKALWVPGAKVISIPKKPVFCVGWKTLEGNLVIDKFHEDGFSWMARGKGLSLQYPKSIIVPAGCERALNWAEYSRTIGRAVKTWVEYE
jgi:hypothetical protein